MAQDRRQTQTTDEADADAAGLQAKIGASALTDSAGTSSGSRRAVQLKVGASSLAGGALGGGGVQQVADAGVAGSGGGQLPHLAAIQQAFGRHDVSGVEAHVGGSAATSATRALGAEAYATGNQVAFQGAPSLHTAAHEAAHVVQQRGGVQLKGGTSSAGDEHEQHADAVADLVVQGKSAEGLLSRYSGGGGGGGRAGVQAKGGDLNTQILPRYREQPEQRATVLESLPGGVERDKDKNNVAKVALENAIAKWVVDNTESFFGPVKDLSKQLGTYLERREEHIGTGVEDSLKALAPDKTTYGRMAAEAAAYPDRLRGLLAGEGTLHEHLLVQQMFVDKIYNVDAGQIVKELSDKFADLIGVPMEKDALKPKDGAVDIGIGSTTYESGHDDARAVEKKQSNIPKVETGGLGPYNKDVHGEGEMVRGTDRFVSVESNAFVQAARTILDMPISGTGLSGSATDLFACAKLFGLAEREDFALATFSFFAKAGAHTFHEVMLMAKATGFNAYVPGDYLSAIPEARREKLKSDLSTHAEVLENPSSAGAVEHEADEKLHGWKDVLTLDGDVEGWAPKVKAFIAGRFGVEAEAVTITPISEGKSGDKVYKVDVVREEKAPFKGIFKVFHDPDVADTEIQIGEKMKEKGVSTPSNFGMSRVEAEDGSASKAGVLFERAEGESPHDIVKKIGPLGKEAEDRKPLIEQLQKAVVAVAKQLATLHGKATTEKAGRAHVPTELKVASQMAKDVKQGHEKGLYEAHLKAAVKRNRFNEGEPEAVVEAFDQLLKENVVDQKLRKSMTHGDANAGNFIVNDEQASIIDVNTGEQSLGPSGDPKKTGASDTGRFLESLRTAYPGALTEEELTGLDKKFHAAYLPGTAEFTADGKIPSNKESAALKKVDTEKEADEKAEVYYRACWVLNQLSHAEEVDLQRTLKARLIELIPSLSGKLELG